MTTFDSTFLVSYLTFFGFIGCREARDLRSLVIDKRNYGDAYISEIEVRYQLHHSFICLCNALNFKLFPFRLGLG